MNNNKDLIEIIYSESIEKYVLIIKRFPNKPIILYHFYDELYNYIMNFLNGEFNEIELDYLSSEFITNELFDKNFNEYYYIQISKKHTIIYSNSATNSFYDIESLTELERNEVINKLLEFGKLFKEEG